MYNLLQVEEFKVDLSLTKMWLDDRRRVLVACVGDGRRESVLLSKEMQRSKVELSLSSLDLAQFILSKCLVSAQAIQAPVIGADTIVSECFSTCFTRVLSS